MTPADAATTACPTIGGDNFRCGLAPGADPAVAPGGLSQEGPQSMTRTRSIALSVGVGLVLALSACGNGPPEVAGGAGGGGGSVGTGAASGVGTPAKQVAATSDLKFNPTSITVKTGEVIQWTNTGGVPHNVTFDQYQALTSQTLQQNDTWQVKFTTAGTYAYHCTFHPGMDGQITVSG